MANYQKAGVKLTNTQLNKLKSSSKNKTEEILRLSKKNFENEELPDGLFLTSRQTTKIRNAFANNMSTDKKPSKAQISKIVQSGDSFGSWLANLEKKTTNKCCYSLSQRHFTWSSTQFNIECNKFDRKISGEGAVRAGKVFDLFISNEDMNDFIKMIKSLEDSGLLIDGVTETVKY